MQVLIDTRTVPPADTLEFWMASSKSAFNPLHMASVDREAFQARMWGDELGPLGVFRIIASASTMTRTAADITAGDPECVQFSILLSGRLQCAQDHRVGVIDAGDMISYDTSTPAVVRAPVPFEMLAVRVPKALLRGRADQVSRLTAVRIPGSQGWPRLAAKLYTELVAGLADDCLDSCDEDLADLTLFLLRHVHSSIGEVPHAPTATGAELLLRAQSYIDTNLRDPGLSPEQIAHACYVSVRSLHYAFADANLTVRKWIQSQRLGCARRDLADPISRRTIADIAHRWGFSSAAHFSRLFRAEYGLPPSEFRRAESIATVADPSLPARARVGAKGCA